MAQTLLALDQGTTSSRAIVFDLEGRPLASAGRPLTARFPSPGLVEQDAEEIWTGQRDAAVEALQRAGLTWADVAGVGLTNQRETTVVWERSSGRPIAPAIVWQDRRTAETCRRLVERGAEALVTARTGLVIDPYFAATKLAWLLDHVPGARAAAEAGQLAFGTVDTWLAWRLSGGRIHATDPSNASRTLLFDIQRLAWDDELLELFAIPRGLLPEVRPSASVWTSLADGPLAADVPLCGVAGDQQAALAGQGCTAAGQAKCTYGTGCFLLTHTGERPRPSAHRLLSTVAWSREGVPGAGYALEGSVFAGGATVQWLRDGLGLIDDAAQVEALARQVDDSGGVVLVPAFAGLGAPHWDAAARGAVLGLTRGTTAAHLARAALDGIAHQVADLTEAMAADGAAVASLRVDGGAAANDLLMQRQADLCGVPLVRPVVTESTALGAAWLAGLALGLWSDGGLEAARAEERRFEPDPSSEPAADRETWRRAVGRAGHWAEG